MPLLLLSNIIVFLSAFLLVKKFFSTYTSADKILLCFLLFLSQIIIVELICGILKRFYFFEILSLHCLILFMVILCSPKRDVFSFRKPAIDFIFNYKILALAISVFFCFFIVKMFVNLINPPVYADSLQYHLVFPAYWIKNGNLVNPFYLFGGIKGYPEISGPTYQPINAQLFFAWLMLPLKNAFLADIGEAPFYLIGILAVYSILRKFSVTKTTALFSGLLWVLIPNLFKQLKYGSQIDVICAVLFLLTLNSLLLLKSEFTLKNASIFGISLGVFIGTKLFNMIWAGALLPITIYYFLKKFPTITPKRMFLIIFVIFATVFVFGMNMYMKNFMLSGNPFFPFKTKILGRLILPGLIDNVTFSKVYLAGYANGLYDLLFSEGLGVQFIAFILPGTLVPLIFYKFAKNNTRSMSEYLLFCAIPVTMLLFYYFFIKVGCTRYLFPYLGIGLIVSVVFFDKFKWGKKYMANFGFISIIASASELAHRGELVVSLILSFTLFVFFLIAKERIINVYNKMNGVKVFALTAVILAGVFYFLNEKYDREEFLRYPSILSKKESWQQDIAFGWRWLNENTKEGKRIAYVGRSEIYPLFGTKLKNEVFYVPVNKIPMVPYNLDVGFYRKEKNLEDWLNNLENLKIDFLFIALPQEVNSESDDPREFPLEDQWALLHPERFSPVLKNSLVHIYRVLY